MAQVYKTIIVTAALVSSLFAQEIIEKPENTTVTVGSELTLTCEVSSPDKAIFMWKEFITNPIGEDIFVVQPDNYPEGELHDPSKYEIRDTFDLHIKEVVTRDGGRYSCELFAGSKGAAEIIVL
ncbi:hypothetical protein CAPTEDRAFT_185102, partial [Capitella teleta]